MANPHTNRPCALCQQKRQAAAAKAREIMQAALKRDASGVAKAAVQTGKVLAEGAAMMVGLKSKTD